jgi:hypothetical protein
LVVSYAAEIAEDIVHHLKQARVASAQAQPEAAPEAPLDPIEAAVFGILGQPASGWTVASRVARRIGYPRREVDAALARLAARGAVERKVEWVARQIVTVWRGIGWLR